MVRWVRLHAPNAGSPGSVPGWGIKIPQAAKKKKKRNKCYIKLPQSCPTLCNAMVCNPPGSSVHGFPRKEYWSGLPFPSPGDLLNPGMEPTSLVSPALQADSSPAEPPEMPTCQLIPHKNRTEGDFTIPISLKSTQSIERFSAPMPPSKEAAARTFPCVSRSLA